MPRRPPAVYPVPAPVIAPPDDEAQRPISPLVGRILRGFGRTLVVAGVLLLLFAGFQLWGTGFAEARAQDDLTSRFRAQHGPAREQPTDPPASSTAVPDDIAGGSLAVDPGPPAPASLEASPVVDGLNAIRRRIAPAQPGDPVAVLIIPAIGVSKTVVEGTSRDVLRSGPGHYGPTPLPGRPGNAAIAGHRTTHGAPFFDIDLLEPGDEIEVETPDGSFIYLVEGQDDGSGREVGHLIVDPEDVEVIADKGDTRLTLTACYPKYSAKQRIIVTATLRPEDLAGTGSQPAQPAGPAGPAGTVNAVDQPTAAGTDQDSPNPAGAIAWAPEGEAGSGTERPADQVATSTGSAPAPTTGSPHGLGGPIGRSAVESIDGLSIEESLGWQRDYAGPTAVWAALTALIGLAGWVIGRFWRRRPAYAMTLPPFGLALFYCFANLERFLPAV